MADEVAELVVKITGDASDLESTINGVASELSQLEQVQRKSNGTTASGTKGLDAYKKQMQQAQTTLQTSRTALSNTKKAYGDNVKSVTKNVSALKTQKTELDKQISLRSNEKRLLTEANKHLDKNSVAYKDNQKALKWINTEIDSYTAQSKKISDSIRTQETALAGSKKAYTDAQATVKKATQQYKEYESGLEAVERAAKAQNLQETGKSMKEMGEGIDTVTKPLQYAAVALAAGGVASAKFAIEFEDSYASVKKTVDGTPEQLDAIKQSIIDMSTVGINGHNAIPMTTDKLNELAAAGGQLGITVDNIADFTEVMAQMETATNLAGEEGAATLARFQNVMGISQSEIRNVGSAIVDLGNNSATTEAEIAAMALRMGKYGQTVGMSAADVLGYSAALSSLGIEAQMGGSAVGRTWLSIETAVANGGEELQAFAKYAGKSAKEFKEQWNTDSKGAFNGLLKGLQSADNLTIALQNIGVENTQDIQAMMALVNGYDLVTESVERANTAYTENTALQNEFNAKAETTASQIAVVKNNFIEAARGIGETMLPTIKDLSGDLVGFAQKLSSMSEEQKKSLVNTGLTIIGLGAGAKVVTGGIKTIGNTIEGIGKIKGSKVFKTIASGIAAIPAPAKAAVVGIAALGVAGKVAYDNWYDSQYHWSKGLSEGNEKIKESLDKYKNLSDIQGQIKSLKLIIENPDSSKAQVDDAKAKLEEIKALLEKEYNLVIHSDNSNLEDAVEQAREISKNDLQSNINDQRAKLASLVNNDTEYEQRRKEAQKNYDKEFAKETKYSEAKEKISNITAKIAQNEISAAEGYKEAQEIYKEITGFEYENPITDPSAKNAKSVLAAATSNYKVAKKLKDDFDWQIDNLDGSHAELHAVSEELANWETEIMRIAAIDKDGDGITQALQDMKGFIEAGELDLEGYAQAAALAMNGVDSLETAWSQAANGDGTALSGIVNDYIRSMKEFGASAKETATGAALIQNGFRTIEEAANAGAIDSVVDNFITKGQELGLSSNDIVSQAAALKNGFKDMQGAIDSGNISGVINDLGKLGGDMGMTIEDVNKLAHSIGLIPDSKKIEINAEGNYEVVNDISSKFQFLDNVNVSVKVNDDGSVSILDKATLDARELNDLGVVAVRLNAEGNIELLNEAEEKVGVVDGKTAEVTFTANTTEAENAANEIQPDPVQADLNLETEDAKKKINDLNDLTVKPNLDVDTQAADAKIKGLAQTITVTVATTDAPQPQAKGTQNFPGGLAMVNDQTGIADNRELIVDRGRAFIPEGRNVVLPLSKGAKVYTAAQTKAIMRGIGIPRYASGKNNSDAFTTAKDNWTHYTKTHSVTTAQELEKWLEFQEKYKDNEKDIWDIEEQIFSLQQKITQELNNQSKAYLEERSALNDWEDIGDSPLEAFARIKDRNYQDLQDAKITWDDYVKNVSDAGETLYDGMLKQSDNWLEHQRKYHNMSIDDYIAGIDREEVRLEEFYANDAVNYQKYIEEKQALEEKRFDAVAEKNADEYTAWKKDADAWQELRSTYGDWDKYGDSEEDFLKRKIQRVKKFYEEGRISFEEYIDDTNEYSMDLYKAQEGYVDDLLQKQSDYISELREQFSEQEQALRDSWDVEDRKVDMADVQNQLDIYAGAVTDRGMQKYKELEKEMQQLQREEQLYNLQVKNNATIESLEAEYKQMEEGKANILEGLRTANINISGYVNSISESLSRTGNNVTSLLSTLIDKFDNFKVESNSMTDNRKYWYNISQMTPEQKQDFLNNLVKL